MVLCLDPATLGWVTEIDPAPGAPYPFANSGRLAVAGQYLDPGTNAWVFPYYRNIKHYEAAHYYYRDRRENLSDDPF